MGVVNRRVRALPQGIGVRWPSSVRSVPLALSLLILSLALV